MPLVADVVITQPAPSVTVLVPLSAVGRHLRIRARGASDAPNEHVSVGLQINGDTAAHYSWVWAALTAGAPAQSVPASGGGDEVRARVGLVPGVGVGVVHAVGDVLIDIPDFQDTQFLRTFTFQAGETLGITKHVGVVGSGAYYADQGVGSGPLPPYVPGHEEAVGYAASPGGMGNGMFDAVTGLWFDTNAGSPPNSTRTVGGYQPPAPTGGELNTPAAVVSVTLLLDVGNWVAGSRVQLYVDE